MQASEYMANRRIKAKLSIAITLVHPLYFFYNIFTCLLFNDSHGIIILLILLIEIIL
jgi:hypothetical protein